MVYDLSKKKAFHLFKTLIVQLYKRNVFLFVFFLKYKIYPDSDRNYVFKYFFRNYTQQVNYTFKISQKTIIINGISNNYDSFYQAYFINCSTLINLNLFLKTQRAIQKKHTK